MSDEKKTLADTLMNLTLPIGLHIVNKFSHNQLSKQLNQIGENQIGGNSEISSLGSNISTSSISSNFVENDKHQELPQSLLND